MTTLQRVSLDIRGMTCSACALRLEKAFQNREGIDSALVNLTQEKATLLVDPVTINLDELRTVVEHTGFDVGTHSRTFYVEGMSCSACSSRVETALLNVPGVLTADVNLALEQAKVKVTTHAVSDERLSSAVEQAGYQLIAPSEESTLKQESEKVDDREKLILTIACLISIPFLVQMIAQFAGWDWIHMMPAAELVLATPLQLVIGARFYRSAFNALRSKTANMDVLVVLGTSAAYLFSWYLMLTLGEAAEGELYFEAAVLILTLVLVGKRLESRAKRATTSAIRDLLDLRPPQARLKVERERWELRPTSELSVGKLFELRPGDRVPADGEVIEGISTLDEALLTGESALVSKKPGDSVFEGSINREGRLVVETTALGEDGTLKKIVQAIENAQHGKLQVQRLVDRVSAIFVPTVIAIATLVFLGWLVTAGDLETALINAVSVLVIACPCALGLATPTAIVTGTGVAAKLGVLYKDVHCIEVAQRVDLIAFDKTGTITLSEPTLGSVSTSKDVSEKEALSIAASLQSQSEHPIANAFLKRAELDSVELAKIESFENFVAEGVTARIDGQQFWLGNERLMQRVFREGDFKSTADEEVLYLASAMHPLAEFEIHDTIREEAVTAIQRLRDLNIETQLFSGDTETKTRQVAEELGMDQYQSRLKPDEKVRLLDDLAAQGKVVGMVGDGVNDAPALARAELGIAMNTSAGVAIEVAPVSLIRNDLGLVATAIQASRRTFRKIKQNLFWAFVYNVIMLPLAAMGFLTPTIAGAAMALSSLSVVTNSLLLRTWKPSQ